MFLPIGETTVIDRIFADLEADDRVDEVLVSTNERFADDFRAYLDDSSFEKPRLSVEETRDEDEKFGVVGALAELVERETVDDDMLVVAGDNVISFDLRSFIDGFEAKGTPVLAAYDVGSPERTKQYSALDLDDNDRVVDFQEKPSNPTSSLISIACYIFPEDSLSLLDEYLAGENNPDEPGWFIQWLQARNPVHAFTFDEAWFDIGTAESYLEAVAWHLDGENRIAPSATVENTAVGENVHVMAGAEIRDSSLDRSVVFPEATIANSDIRSSIIDEHTQVENMDLAGALIGAHSEVTDGK
jgi:glucose-1-phosphate thymidylyltransferase